jgi:hypothetical protein
MELVSPTHTRGRYAQSRKSTPRMHYVRDWQRVLTLGLHAMDNSRWIFLWSLSRWMYVVDASYRPFWRVGFILCIQIFINFPWMRWSNYLKSILHTEEFINDCNLTRTHGRRDWQGDSRLGMTTSRLNPPNFLMNIDHWMGLMEDICNQLNRVGVIWCITSSVSMP